MESSLPPVSPPTERGLPPVQPPSATMLLRLFLVPFLIVAVLVGLYLVGQTIYGKLWRTRSPEKVLRDLDNPNPEVRWRAAADLAQELPRSPDLAANAWFALELTERLQAARDEAAGPEREFARTFDSLPPAERAARISRDLEPRRNLITFLGAALGHFVVPAGVPVLCKMATQTAGMEPVALAKMRRQALWALATAGEKLQQYDALPGADKDRIDEQLDSGNRRFAEPCLAYLQARRQGKADSFGVAGVIEKCAADNDPSIRKFVAFASNFWRGSAAEDAKIEKALVALSRDSGQGENALDALLEKNPDSWQSREVTTRPGFEVQVNANIALARRGSPHVRFDLFDEMLDPQRLGSIFLVRTGDGQTRPNESLVYRTLAGSLSALAELSARRPELRSRIDRLLPRVEALAGDSNPDVSGPARKALDAIRGKA